MSEEIQFIITVKCSDFLHVNKQCNILVYIIYNSNLIMVSKFTSFLETCCYATKRNYNEYVDQYLPWHQFIRLNIGMKHHSHYVHNNIFITKYPGN